MPLDGLRARASYVFDVRAFRTDMRKS